MSVSSSRLTGAVTVELGNVVLAVAGEFDLGTRETFRRLLDAAVAAAGEEGAFHLDLDLLETVDSAGLAVLAQLAEQVEQGKVTVDVRGATDRVFGLLESAQLLQVLNVARPPASPTLVQGLAGVAQSAGTLELLDAALKLVVTMAQAVIVGADGVSITLPRQGRYRTVAASNDVVLAMDHDQYDTEQGPCLDAARRGQRFHIDSLGEESRWADFTPRARARGIESILSSPLLDAEHPLGALNIYSRRTGAFAVHEKEWANQFAAEASAVLTTAQRLAPSPELLAQILPALHSRQVIAQAQGIVMYRDGLGPDAAYAQLRDRSRASSTPLLAICEALTGPRAARGGPRRTDPS